MDAITFQLNQWLLALSELFAPAIDLVALAMLVVGTVEALIGAIRMLATGRSREQRREVWLRYSNWLVAALTFQLAADIIETSAAPTWDDIGRLAIIAVVRTALNFFLERDQRETRELIKDDRPAA